MQNSSESYIEEINVAWGMFSIKYVEWGTQIIILSISC